MICAVLCILVFNSSCAVIWPRGPSASGFLRRDFMEYARVAILPFEGPEGSEVSDVFIGSFYRKFPEREVVERGKLSQVFREQDLYPSRLDPNTRARIGKVFGVQALVLGYIRTWPDGVIKRLQVKIVDTETGVVLGQSLVTNDSILTDWREACDMAVSALR